MKIPLATVLLTLGSTMFAQNRLRFDFEKGSTQGWFISEGNIKTPVTKAADYKGISGEYVISTLYDKTKGNDDMTGVIESPVIKLSNGKVSFIQGGGSGKAVKFSLFTLDGKEVASSRGYDNVQTRKVEWNKPELAGKKVYFQLIDNAKGPWGHMLIDAVEVSGKIDAKSSKKRKKSARGPSVTPQDENTFNPEAIEKAIRDTGRRFPGRYPSEQLLKELEPLTKALKASPDAAKDPALADRLKAFKKKALLSNPFLTDQPLLVNIRDQFWGSHCPHGTLFPKGEEIRRDGTGGYYRFVETGAALKVLNFTKSGEIADVKTIVNTEKGVIRDPEISFDAKKVIFSMRHNKDDNYSIYEADIDGSNIRQLTFGGPGIADVDPIYMPDSKVTFSSTRQPTYCQCNIHIQTSLFLMNRDGSNIIQTSRNNLSDFQGNLMPDGRILYSRWEYIDRHFGPSLGLWTSNPDGTSHQLYMGNNHWTPGAMLDGRVIPGTKNVVCIYGSCHDRPWGALTIVDRSKGMEGPEPVVKMWPQEEGMSKMLPSDLKYSRDPKYRGMIDSFIGLSVKYEDPWPLHNLIKGDDGGTYFLVSKTIGKYRSPYGGTKGQADMGIFLVDIFGNETLVYKEEGRYNNCFDAMPVAARKRPPVIPSRVDLTKKEGTFYVMDVYTGTGDEMVNVKRGSAKWLRVLEGPRKEFWREGRHRNVDATQASPMNWNLTNNKRILGDVPVEADGSVYFTAPADKFLHFLLLDENKMMIQAMRTGTMLRPGEVQGCYGCHENRLSPPPNKMNTLAMKRAPSKIQPWLGYSSIEATPAFNFLTEVQPVFDKHCVSCHDFGKQAGKKLILAGDPGLIFNASYTDLMRKSRIRYDGPREVLVSIVNDGPPGVLPAYAWGSHKSTLIKTILKGHEDVKLSDEEFHRIVTWIDLNGVYYGEYSSVYQGRNPLTAKDYSRLKKLCKIGNLQNDEIKNGSLVSFTRPEKSPVLKRAGAKESPEYKEALEIIRRGAEQLKKQPREDQLGGKVKSVFPDDVERSKRVKRYYTEEEKSIRAILSGKKYYQYKQ